MKPLTCHPLPYLFRPRLIFIDARVHHPNDRSAVHHRGSAFSQITPLQIALAGYIVRELTWWRLAKLGSCVAIFFCAAVGAGCSPSSGPANSPETPATDTQLVQLSVDHRTEWRVLWVEGTTDLPNGAYVNYRVVHELAETSPAKEWPAANLMESGRATVQTGRFWAKINTLHWPDGEVCILVQFPLPPQPPAVEARYGAFGEHLAGENISDLGGMKAVEVEHTFEYRR